MLLTPIQRRLIERVINAAETGTPDGNYGAVVVYNDGPHGIKQITYGRSQTTEYGNLRKLISMYIQAGGVYAGQMTPYLDRIGADPLLCTDKSFIKLLKDAGNKDPKMAQTQDIFFEKIYFQPAMHWAEVNGFILPLSALIIYDSYIHSGQILWLLRNQFSEVTPAAGGDEKAWITAYTQTRDTWLSGHSKPVIQKSHYRTKCYLNEIANKNWDLIQTPIVMNGIKVTP